VTIKRVVSGVQIPAFGTALSASTASSVPAQGFPACRTSANSRFLMLFLLSFVGIFFFSCGGGVIRDYAPKTSQEAAIKGSLIALESAWNRHSERAVLALLDEDFVMWVWSDGKRKIVSSKGAFGFRLQDIFIRWRYLNLGLPDIWIQGNEATVHVPVSADGRGSRITFTLVNRHGSWLFLEWEFYFNPV
jgi:hypothetical protein